MKQPFYLFFLAFLTLILGSSCIYETTSWSKNGEFVLFSTVFFDQNDDEQYQFFIWNKKDKTVRQVSQFGIDKLYGSSAYLSPNGEMLSYIEQSIEGDEEVKKRSLCTMNIDGTQNDCLLDMQKEPPYHPHIFNPWNPSGTLLNLNTYNASTKIWSIITTDLKGISQKLKTHRSAILPVWSPDGLSIAYLSFEPKKEDEALPKTYDLILHVIATSENIILLQEVPFPQSKDEELISFLAPSWSPDGKHIAYIHDLQIASVNIQNKEQKILTHGENLKLWPRWSPDTTLIAYLVFDNAEQENFTYGDNEIDIWLMHTNGDKQRQLSSLEGEEYLPSWDPDGKRLAFLHTNEYVSFLFSIIDLDGNIDFYPATPSQEVKLAEFYLSDANIDLAKAKALIDKVRREHPDTRWAKEAEELLEEISS